MSKNWARGSTREWRMRRAIVLRANRIEHGGRCQIGLPDVCTGEATEVHHTLGRSVTGDDPRYLVASCKACNLAVGEPAGDPEPRGGTEW